MGLFDWITKVNHVDTIDADHVNKLQTYKADKWEVPIVVTPEAYGAKGDGVTDDTAAIQAAIAAAQCIVFSAKTYMTSGIVVSTSGKVFLGTSGYDVNVGLSGSTGAGLYGTRIKAIGTQDFVLRLQSVAKYCLFENIIFDGAWTTTDVVSMRVSTDHCWFKHCTFMACIDYLAGDPADTKIAGAAGGSLVYDDSATDENGNTVSSTMGDNITFEECIFTSGDSAKLSAVGLMVRQPNAFLIDVIHCVFYLARTHVYLSSAGIRIKDSEFEAYSNLAIYADGVPKDILVSNNYSECDSTQRLKFPWGTVAPGAFFYMDPNTAALHPAPFVFRMNQTLEGMSIVLIQPTTLENNQIRDAVVLYPPGSLTSYHKVLSIRNELIAGFAGPLYDQVIEIDDESRFPALGINADRMPDRLLDIGGIFSGSAAGAIGIATNALTLSPDDAKDATFALLSGAVNVPAGENCPTIRGVSVGVIEKTGTGTVTQAYGIFCDTPTAATNNYCAWLNGKVGINDPYPGWMLDVNGDINATGVIRVADVQVLGAQGAAVADATNAADVITQLNALLARLRAHGLIAT